MIINTKFSFIQILVLTVILITCHSYDGVNANMINESEALENDQYHRNLRKVEASMSRPLTSSYENPTPGEGLWPECVGQTGEWCLDYIGGWVSYVAHKAAQEGATRPCPTSCSFAR